MFKKIVLLSVLALIFSTFQTGTVVLASGPQPIAQGITIRAAAVFTSDARGWRQIGLVPTGTQIGIYLYDSNWVKNDPSQWMRRWDVAIYGVDIRRETNWGSSLLGQAGQPIQIGEVVSAKEGCMQYPGCWESPYCRVVPADTSMKVVGRQDNFLAVHLNSSADQPAWVRERCSASSGCCQ